MQSNNICVAPKGKPFYGRMQAFSEGLLPQSLPQTGEGDRCSRNGGRGASEKKITLHPIRFPFPYAKGCVNYTVCARIFPLRGAPLQSSATPQPAPPFGGAFLPLPLRSMLSALYSLSPPPSFLITHYAFRIPH